MMSAAMGLLSVWLTPDPQIFTCWKIHLRQKLIIWSFVTK
jgi:hypothetical protein